MVAAAAAAAAAAAVNDLCAIYYDYFGFNVSSVVGFTMLYCTMLATRLEVSMVVFAMLLLLLGFDG